MNSRLLSVPVVKVCIILQTTNSALGKWSQLSGIPAIPHYIIYDRQGGKLMEEVGWNNALAEKLKTRY